VRNFDPRISLWGIVQKYVIYDGLRHGLLSKEMAFSCVEIGLHTAPYVEVLLTLKTMVNPIDWMVTSVIHVRKDRERVWCCRWATMIPVDIKKNCRCQPFRVANNILITNDEIKNGKSAYLKIRESTLLKLRKKKIAIEKSLALWIWLWRILDVFEEWSASEKFYNPGQIWFRACASTEKEF